MACCGIGMNTRIARAEIAVGQKYKFLLQVIIIGQSICAWQSRCHELVQNVHVQDDYRSRIDPIAAAQQSSFKTPCYFKLLPVELLCKY